MNRRRVLPKITYRERADHYDVECSTDVDNEFLASLVTPSVRSILEVPCGSGRNFDWLCGTGRSVCMVDIEPQMVARVCRKIQETENSDRVTALVGDMRNLRLESKFDLILVPREGFQMLTTRRDALSALRRLRTHLESDGLLEIDLAVFDNSVRAHHTDKTEYFYPAGPDGVEVHEWTRALPQGGLLSRSRIQRNTTTHLHTRFLYQLDSVAGETSYFQAMLRLKKYDLSGFLMLCTEAQLSVHAVYGDYSRTTYSVGDSRMIFLLGGSR